MTITNLELEDLAVYFKIPNFHCVMNDEMLTMPYEDGYYIVNLEDTTDNGSHWVVVIIKNNQKAYWDSFGVVPSLQVIEFFRKSKGKYAFNNRIIQDLQSVLCGWFCLGLIIFCHHFAEIGENDIHILADTWSETFFDDYSKNDKQLRWIFKNKFDYIIPPTSKKVGGDLAAVYNRVVKNQYDYTKSASNILNKFGDQVISSITLKRNPISIPKSVIKLVIKDMPYDELYHLYMDVRTTTGKNITVEKNQVITLTEGISNRGATTDEMNVNMNNKSITINELLMNARSNIGDERYFRYSARTANCQDYLGTLLSSSQMLTPELDKFIKQRGTQHLFSKKDGSRKGVSGKTVNFLTDIAGTLQTAWD